MADMKPNTTAPAQARSEFALPGGHFPIGDQKHAVLAQQMAPKSYNAGNITKAEEETVISKAKAAAGDGKARRAALRAKTPVALHHTTPDPGEPHRAISGRLMPTTGGMPAPMAQPPMQQPQMTNPMDALMQGGSMQMK